MKFPSSFPLAAPGAPFHTYGVFGLTVASQIVCSELLPAEGAPEVTIQYGVVPGVLDPVQQQGPCFQVNSQAFLLKLKSIASYLVTGGKRIVIDPAPVAQDHEVRLFLLGSAFGALLQQRGTLTLHGCAVTVDGGAAVFLGPSGCGKSTLAGALLRRSYQVLTDDVCVLAFSAEGLPHVMPGLTQLKLRADALEMLGENIGLLPEVIPGTEKYALPLRDGFTTRPLPLRRVYELVATSSSDLQITSVSGLDRISVLLRHTYRPEFLAGRVARQLHLAQCGRVARSCLISRIVHSRRARGLAELVDLVENDWAARRLQASYYA